MDSRADVETSIQVLLAKINHKQSILTNRELQALEITRSQFALLVHFLQSPHQAKTISQLVQLMDMNQPGVTKIVRQLLDNGFLEMVKNSTDKRVKELRITQKGLNKCESAVSLLSPMSDKLFSSWNINELKEFDSYLEKMSNALEV